MMEAGLERSMRQNNETVLRKTPLFAALSETEMRALCLRVSNRHFRRGELLFNEGDACAGLFLVASGKIRIFKTSAGGREQVLAMEGPGSSFAELPVFDGGNYPASASAVEDAEVLFISRKDSRICAARIERNHRIRNEVLHGRQGPFSVIRQG